MTVSRYQQFPCNLNTQNYARQYHFQTSPPFEFIAKLCTGQASFLIKSVLHINKMSKTVLIQTPQWGAADADIKVPSDENTELICSPFKAWSSQYIAMHATLTVRDSFLANFHPSGPFTCIFQKPLQIVPCVSCG